MLVPLLERSIELANAIGLKLALEPVGKHRATTLSISDLMVPDCGLGPINLKLSAGQIVVLSGATGSGKSTLLEAVAGILSEYRGREVLGEVKFDGEKSLSIAELSNFIRYLPQNPKELLWGFDVADLVARTPIELSRQLGLNRLPKMTQHLSEGEALKLVLAESLSADPTILLLDEPYSPLDSASRSQLTKILNDLAAQGVAILVVEHEPSHTSGLIAERVQLVAGQLVPGEYQPEPPNIQRTAALVGTETVVRATLKDIDLGRLLIKAPSLNLKQGELVWLAGDNGSGKSSLLKTLAKGDGVLVHGQKPTSLDELVLVPENFDDFFVTDSLLAETYRADQVAGVTAGFTMTTLEAILPGEQLATWLDVHPRDLSRGTRLALAIAMQLSHKPQALLLDEPFRGLDLRARELMVESLRCVAETGCAVLFASHEQSWSAALASRRLEISNQQLRESTEVSA